jgi:hypothetical protein
MQSDPTLAQALPPKRLKETIRAGDFVYCRSKRYRDSLQLPQEVGVVLEIKRATHKILYSSDRRAYVPREALVRMAPPTNAPEVLRIANHILRRIDAHESELTNIDGVYVLSATTDRIEDTTIDELRAFLGKRYEAIRIIPEGMAFIRLETLFK